MSLTLVFDPDFTLRSNEANATRMLQNRHGRFYEAFEFDVPLRVVALSGSIPAEWEQDFKSLLGGISKVKIDRRGQLLDIYEELKAPRSEGFLLQNTTCQSSLEP